MMRIRLGRLSRYLLLGGTLLLSPVPVVGAAGPEATPQLDLANAAVLLQVKARGAAISNLRARADDSDWLAPDGHYLCFDRWGPVTEDESALGIPFHGEAAHQDWRLTTAGGPAVQASTALPVTGWTVRREVTLAAAAPVFKVTTTIINPASVGRPFNAVEHVTLADRWTGDSTVLLTNAVRGFLHHRGQPVADSDFAWPYATWAGRTWDLRGPVRIPGRVLASLVFPDEAEWAWVCLANRDTGEIIGYCWRTADYPWLNLWWRTNREGVAVTRAVEPGTTGLHQPMPVLQAAGVRLGRPLVHTLPPLGRGTLVLWGFVAKGPAGIPPQLQVMQQGTSVRFLPGATAADWQLILPLPAVSK